ncbi:MAG: ABC transporter ATP-binding protein/permease [Magnetospirillum sp.]|nr:ABC transporter ATP-binding protein/permease [Magnetospirillum sp.]
MRLFLLPAALLTELRRACGGKLVLAVAVSTGCALLEGAALLLLAPILVASGVVAGSGPAVSPWLRAPAEALGLERLLLVWLACVVVVTMASAWRDLLVHSLRERVLAHLCLSLHAATLAMEWAAFQVERGSDIVAAMTQHVGRIGLGTASLVNFAARAALIGAQLAVAIAVAPLASLAVVGVAAVFMFSHLPRARLILSRGGAAAARTDDFHAIMAQHLDGMKLAKAHRAEAVFHDDFRRVVKKWGDSLRASSAVIVWSRAVGRVLMALVLVGIVWVAARHAELSAPALAVLLGVVVRLLPAFNDALNLAHVVTEITPSWLAYERLRHRLDLGREASVPASAECRPQGDIVLDQVCFNWPGRAFPAVDSVSMVIPANGTTALIGPSGGGKSTLVDLCVGLLQPQSGEIRVGGKVLTGAWREGWRQEIAYVPQESMFMHDSVRANLLWLSPQAGEADMWHALALAALDETVRALPLGLDTIIGDRGVRLSGGERQRLSVARALLRNPRVLVLDEATSHLDHVSQALLLRTLNSLHGRLTVLVIAHRLEMARHADHVVVIEGGKIREQGNWDVLSGLPAGWLES